jgi:acyl carrier protein
MSLEEKVVAIVRANVPRNLEVTLASDLRRELHLDSFGTLMILNALEDAFAISVQEADFGRVITVADVVELLRSRYACT